MKLPKVRTTIPKRRVGRGGGSGRGFHTVGRGQKGQKSRNANHILFEGVKTRKSLLVRLPLLRGKDKFKPKAKAFAINLSDLNSLKAGAKVDAKSLLKAGVVTRRDIANGVKILGSGELTKKLTVMLPVSSGARGKIEKAGGKVEVI